jgi:predicted naringenin-chalcone synthase
MSLHILGIGTALPECVIDQREAAELAATLCCSTDGEKRSLAALYRRAGVAARRSVVLDASTNGHAARQSFYRRQERGGRGPSTTHRMQRYEQEAAPLALRAARAALRDARVSPAAITHLVTVSCSGFAAPGFDQALVHELGLPASIARSHIGFMGCHGALNGLRVAKAFAESDPAARVLVCAVELCSLHQHYTRRVDQMVANALFGDGAAAVVGSSSPESAEWRVSNHGSALIPGTTDLMGWRIGDHGFEMSLSREVPAAIRRHLRPWLDQWLGDNGLETGGIGSWAVHPGGPRILQACAEAAGFAPERLADSHQVLRELGNMSSPTVLFILDRLRRREAPRPCVMLAFGPGLAIEAALVQ